jgi:hypothetical protein
VVTRGTGGTWCGQTPVWLGFSLTHWYSTPGSSSCKSSPTCRIRRSSRCHEARQSSTKIYKYELLYVINTCRMYKKRIDSGIRLVLISLHGLWRRLSRQSIRLVNRCLGAFPLWPRAWSSIEEPIRVRRANPILEQFAQSAVIPPPPPTRPSPPEVLVDPTARGIIEPPLVPHDIHRCLWQPPIPQELVVEPVVVLAPPLHFGLGGKLVSPGPDLRDGLG